MNLLKIQLIIIVFGYCIMMPANVTASNDKIQFIASFSGQLQKGILSNNQIKIIESVAIQGLSGNIYWPINDKAPNFIYFESTGNLDDIGFTDNVYRYSLFDKKLKMIIKNGKYPSISPDGHFLSFYRHPNQLWIYSIKNKTEKKIIDDVAKIQPCVWTSNTSLLYYDILNKLAYINVLTVDKKETGYKNIIPSVLSPDEKKVLCVSSDGKKIYLYYPFSKEISLIKESNTLSFGSRFIWLVDGNGFLYTKQVWPSILRFNETGDLFVHLSNGKETHLLKKIELFGGMSFW